MGVSVGSGVGVGVAVSSGVGVAVGRGVFVGVFVAIGVGVLVGVGGIVGLLFPQPAIDMAMSRTIRGLPSKRTYFFLRLEFIGISPDAK